MKHDMAHDPQMLSALADGRLQGDALAQAVAQATETEEGRATWHAYQVVGDVLRSADLADCRADADFLARLRQRMAAEDTPQALVLQPDSLPVVAAPAQVAAPAVTGSAALQAANRRWRLLAVAASVAAISALGWQWMGSGLLPTPAAQMAVVPPAAAPAVVVATTPATAPVASASSTAAPVVEAAAAPAVMLRDPRLDELLAAHRQFGGTSALQMPAGFLRNATFEGAGR